MDWIEWNWPGRVVSIDCSVDVVRGGRCASRATVGPYALQIDRSCASLSRTPRSKAKSIHPPRAERGAHTYIHVRHRLTRPPYVRSTHEGSIDRSRGCGLVSRARPDDALVSLLGSIDPSIRASIDTDPYIHRSSNSRTDHSNTTQPTTLLPHKQEREQGPSDGRTGSLLLGRVAAAAAAACLPVSPTRSFHSPRLHHHQHCPPRRRQPQARVERRRVRVRVCACACACDDAGGVGVGGA